jgi:hypothetical protein
MLVVAVAALVILVEQVKPVEEMVAWPLARAEPQQSIQDQAAVAAVETGVHNLVPGVTAGLVLLLFVC